MEKIEWTKTKGFRLPKRTLEQLDYLIEKGAGRNATEVIIVAVERLATQYQEKERMLSVSTIMQLLAFTADENTGTSQFLKDAVAHIPEQLVHDRQAMINTLGNFWEEDDMDKLKDMTDDDLKKMIAIRLNLSKKLP